MGDLSTIRGAPMSPGADDASVSASGWHARVERVGQGAGRVLLRVRLLAIVSAGSAILLWWMAAGGWLLEPGWTRVVSLGVLVGLLIPAAGTGLALWLIRGVLALPKQVKAMPEGLNAAYAAATKDYMDGEPAGRRRRLLGFISLLWKTRAVARSARGGWVKVLGVARFAKLASLPLIIVLTVCFLLNFVVVGMTAFVFAAAGLALWL